MFIMNKSNLKELIKHGSIYFPCATYIVENKKNGLLVKYHWHNEFEIIHFQKGKFKIQINMDKYIVKNECFCFINSKDLHSVKGDSLCIESAIVFNLKMISFNMFDLTESELINPILTGKLKMPKFICKDDIVWNDVFNEYKKIINIYKKNILKNVDKNSKENVLLQMKIKTSILNILAVLYNSNFLVNEPYKTNNYRIKYIKKIILYIESNYKKKICIKDLAKEINMNEQYFCRFFKNATGKSPIKYTNEYRIKKSEELLKETNMKIIEVCLESGFNNMGNFINTFKKQTGLSPIAYRKCHKSDVIKI